MLNDVIKWNWTKHYLDFGRPLDLSGGHIFHKKEIFKLFKSWKYESLEELENNFDKLDYYPKEYMASYTESKLCNINDVTEPTYEKNLTFDFKNINKKTIEI